MEFETASKPWPFLVYDRWSAFLHLQMWRQGVALDRIEPLKQPPYGALAEGDHRGIVIGMEGDDDCPEATEGVFRLWVDRLEPDTSFDLDFLADVVAKARTAGIGEDMWSAYEERMSQSRRRPLRHPPPVEAILGETRGFLFYRDQPARVLGVIMDLPLDTVDLLLKGRIGAKMVETQRLEFVRRVSEFDVDESYADNLWRACFNRYRHCLPREFVDARRSQILWALSARARYPELFNEAWKVFNQPD